MEIKWRFINNTYIAVSKKLLYLNIIPNVIIALKFNIKSFQIYLYYECHLYHYLNFKAMPEL